MAHRVLVLVALALAGLARAQEQDLIGINTQGSLYRIDPITGDHHFLASTGLLANALGADSLGRLYVAGNTPGQTHFFRIDPLDGSAVLVATTQLLSVRGLAFTDDDELFVINSDVSGTDEPPDDLFRIDLDLQTATFVACLGNAFLQSLAFANGEL